MGVGRWITGAPFLGVAVKAGGSFSPADLAGAWPLVSGLADQGLTLGYLTFNPTGLVTGGQLNDNLVQGGSVLLTADGTIPAGFVVTATGTDTIESGALTRSKRAAVAVGRTALRTPVLTLALRPEAAYAPADLAGTWQVFSLLTLGAGTGWSQGTVQLNPAGAVTGGTLTGDDGTRCALTGGALSLLPVGIGSGTVQSPCGGAELPFIVLRAAKDYAIGVNLADDAGLFVLIRAPGP